MYTVTKTWRHINSEGWEKYHDEMDLNCILQFETKDELYLDVSTIYRYLSERSKWTTAELETLLNKYKYHDFSVPSIPFTSNTHTTRSCRISLESSSFIRLVPFRSRILGR